MVFADPGAHTPLEFNPRRIDNIDYDGELKILCRHASDGSSPRNEARELQANVTSSCAVAILWQLATLILANVQATNSIVVFHPFISALASCSKYPLCITTLRTASRFVCRERIDSRYRVSSSTMRIALSMCSTFAILFFF